MALTPDDELAWQSLVAAPLRSVFKDLSTPEGRLYHDECEGHGARELTSEEEERIKSRDGGFLDAAAGFLEKLNSDVLEMHEHVVRKTLALVGWFSLVFAAFGVLLAFLRDSSVRLPGCAWFFASLFIAASAAAFVWSLWGSCRVLWRMKFYADDVRWLKSDDCQTAEGLKIERVLELIQRIPFNKSRVGVKARLYQGSVWSFFLAVALEVAAIAVVSLGMLTGRAG